MKQEIIEKICKKNENWLICTRDEINYIVKECMNEYAKEQLILNGVSRSVWVVQNKTSKVAHCIFTTQEEAIDCIDGLSNFEVKEFSLVNNVDL